MKLGSILLFVGALFVLFNLTYGSRPANNVVEEQINKFCYKTLPRLDSNCDHALQDCDQEFLQRFGKDSQPHDCKCITDPTNLYHTCSCNVVC
ncbi:hypothetical protein P8452_58952 [Trifolium repens]|nr:hypothetical protein P8452_58952 [Trifolium repens]